MTTKDHERKSLLLCLLPSAYCLPNGDATSKVALSNSFKCLLNSWVRFEVVSHEGAKCFENNCKTLRAFAASRENPLLHRIDRDNCSVSLSADSH